MANTTNIDLVKPAGTDYALVSVLNSNSDKIDAEAGRERANFAGTYSTSSAYAVGAYCIYQGNLYRCKTAIGSGGEAWTSGHWDQVSVGTELTTLNNKIDNKLQSTILTSVGNKKYNVVNPSGNAKPFGILIFSYTDIYLVSSINAIADLSLARITTGTIQSYVSVSGRTITLGSDNNRNYTLIAPAGFTFVETT